MRVLERKAGSWVGSEDLWARLRAWMALMASMLRIRPFIRGPRLDRGPQRMGAWLVGLRVVVIGLGGRWGLREVRLWCRVEAMSEGIGEEEITELRDQGRDD